MLVAASLLLSLARLPLSAEEPSLTLGPGCLSFPQIAKALSVNGRVVTCPTSLANRAALVRLKERSWKDAARLLEAGLDLRLAPKNDDPSTWLLERDPKTEAREKDFLNRFLAGLRSELNRKLAGEGFAKPYAELYSRFETARRELDEIRREDGPEGKDGPRVREALHRVRLLEGRTGPYAWLAARALSRGVGGDLAYLLKEPVSLRQVDPRAIADTESLRAIWAAHGRLYNPPAYQLEDLLRDNPLPDDIGAYVGLQLSRAGLSVDATVALYGRGRIVGTGGLYAGIGLMTVDSLFRGHRSEEFDNEWPGLGSEANRWLEAERHESRQFLGSEAGSRPFVCGYELPTRSLSRVIQAWSEAEGREVVMELYPLREGAFWGNGSFAGQIAPGTRQSLERLMTPEGCWTFREMDGALLVQNQVAFLDRSVDFPMGAYLDLERSGKGLKSLGQPAGLPLDLALAYARTATAEQNGNWREVFPGEYRGIDVQSLSASYPLARLVAGLPAPQRRALKEAVTKGETFTLPLGRLPLRELHTFIRSCRTRSPLDDIFLRPDFPDLLRQLQARFCVGPDVTVKGQYLRGVVRPDNPPQEWPFEHSVLERSLSLPPPAAGKQGDGTGSERTR